MKNFGKKWFISASSGILGRILLVVLCLGAGFIGGQYISAPIDSEIIKGAGIVVGIVVILFALTCTFAFPLILQWIADMRISNIEAQKLEHEKLQLENENLKLKLELQEKQSQPDNGE